MTADTEAAPVHRTRAKFWCASRTETIDHSGTKTYAVRFNPVTGGSEENKRFYRWTPGGSIEMSGLSEATGEAFKLSKEYYIDFTLAGE